MLTECLMMKNKLTMDIEKQKSSSCTIPRSPELENEELNKEIVDLF